MPRVHVRDLVSDAVLTASPQPQPGANGSILNPCNEFEVLVMASLSEGVPAQSPRL